MLARHRTGVHFFWTPSFERESIRQLSPPNRPRAVLRQAHYQSLKSENWKSVLFEHGAVFAAQHNDGDYLSRNSGQSTIKTVFNLLKQTGTELKI